MGNKKNQTLIKDPLVQSREEYPYEVLAPAGVTPSSSMREVKGALSGMKDHPSKGQEVRLAWDKLTKQKERLPIDCFRYSGDPAETIDTCLQLVHTELSKAVSLLTSLEFDAADLDELKRSARAEAKDFPPLDGFAVN